MRSPTASMTASELQVLADIDADGIHIASVAEGEDGPGYSFTIGMQHSFDQPEVIVFGMPAEIAADLLNAVADEAADGAAFAADAQRDGLLHGYPVRFLAVPDGSRANYFGAAVWAYEGESFPCLQLVWPDKQGRWPWHEDVREGFAELQPVLARTLPPA